MPIEYLFYAGLAVIVVVFLLADRLEARAERRAASLNNVRTLTSADWGEFRATIGQVTKTSASEHDCDAIDGEGRRL